MRRMAFDPFRDVRAAPAIILGNRDLRSPEARAEERRPRPPSREVHLAVDGTFDLAAAVRTAAAARAQAVSTRVTIDLRRARIDDAALATFVREMAGRAIAIIGLSRHHERLLRYLEDGSGTERRAEE